MFHIKPLKDNVIDPQTSAHLEPRGIKVSMLNSYWFRRGQDHDVSITEIDQPAAPEVSDEPQVEFAEKAPKKSNKEKGV